MQGRVSCTSHEGKGSTFFVDLPLAPAAALSETG
jgi:signal transduction histidine kinase